MSQPLLNVPAMLLTPDRASRATHASDALFSGVARHVHLWRSARLRCLWIGIPVRLGAGR